MNSLDARLSQRSTLLLLWLLFAVGVVGVFVVSPGGVPPPVSAEAQPAGNPLLRERLAGFSVGAHRGGTVSFNSNTLKRFERARRDGVDIIETDIRVTKDGVPVVYHDDRVNRLLHHEPLVADLTLEELRAFRMPCGGGIPTFEEVLQWCAGRVVINAEFKDRAVVTPAVKLVQQYDAYHWVYFQTKSDHSRYETARALDSEVALLYKPEGEADLDWAIALNDPNLVVIELSNEMFRDPIIEKVHAAKKLASYNSWRLDGPFQEFFRPRCALVFERDVDIAISNRTAAAARQRDRFETGK